MKQIAVYILPLFFFASCGHQSHEQTTISGKTTLYVSKEISKEISNQIEVFEYLYKNAEIDLQEVEKGYDLFFNNDSIQIYIGQETYDSLAVGIRNENLAYIDHENFDHNIPYITMLYREGRGKLLAGFVAFMLSERGQKIFEKDGLIPSRAIKRELNIKTTFE